MSSQIVMDLGGLLPMAEKRKLLNQFMLKVEANQVDNILQSSKNLPATQYNLLKFLLADKFHRFDLIIELLYDGDSSIIGPATSKLWLYEGADSPFSDGDFLINKLFPNVSYNCRQKVLYRIGRHIQDEQKADQIWNCVEQKYGFHVAFPLLQACTRDKITTLITSRKVELLGYQLVQILKKYPDIGLDYIKHHFTNIGGSSTNSYRSPLVYLYDNHRDDFLDLCINHPDKMNSFKFGRGRSTKIIREYRTKLLEKPAETSSLLKFDRLRREFKPSEFQMFFELSFGKVPSLASVNMTDVWKWANTVPVDQRIDMIKRAFMNLFQVNLDESFEYLDVQYIILLPNEKRLAAIEWKSENDQNYSWQFRDLYVHYFSDDDKKRAYLPLKPISHSVPELQKLLLIEQDVSKRATLSKYLLETCYINTDLSQLLNVLLLLSKRCRNDQCEVRIMIFNALELMINKMEFAKEHWDVIIEMIQVSLVFADARDYSDNSKEKLLEKCIAFHLTAKLPLNNLVAMYIKLKIKTGSTAWTNSFVKSETDRRNLLVLYAKELENLQVANDLRSHDGTVLEGERLSEFVANLIEEICKFNKVAANASPKVEPILFASNQWLRTSLERIAKEEEDRINKKSNVPQSHYSWNFARQLVNIVQALRKEENLSLDVGLNDSETLFSKILHTSPCSSIIKYFIAKNPSLLMDNWPSTLAKMLKSESGLQFMKNLQAWNYSNLTGPAIKVCQEIIDQTLDHDLDVTIQQKCNAVSVLSVLSKPADFLSFAERFYPEDSKVDVFADNSKEEYQIRQAIAKSLVNVSVSHLAFPAVEKFCVGDYLKLAVAALYSHSGRASEVKTLEFLRQKLVKSPVSLKKHIIRLYYVIGSVEQRIAAFKDIDSSNITIRFEIFCRANKLFRSSPSQETWAILKNAMDTVTEEDATIVQLLYTKPKLETFPMEYISEFIIACVTALRKVKLEHVATFMAHLEVIMDQIPEKTLDEIILHKHAEQTSFSSSFCVKYIQNSSTESIAEHRLTNMWLLLVSVIRNGWDTKTPRPYDSNNFDYPTRQSVFGFVSNLCESRMDDASKVWLKTKSLQTLIEKFKVESATKFFKEILYIELGLLMMSDGEKRGMSRLKPFGQNLARFTDNFVAKYGGEIVLILKDVVGDYVEKCFADEFVQNVGAVVELVDGILETSKTRANQIISIFLLRSANPKSGNLVATLKKIQIVLQESDDVVAQMYAGWLTN
ncbi:uncharacterized protein LOC119077840 [Bradysia coprophila]|uniref:uncharacterized protein LOC119077840 n=1 Tax=Bradysia coprophila TaxID=38358 RepID=UPI00187DC782|nr:uncharacterized protein LOC119077840 [Bradysia coprophila]